MVDSFGKAFLGKKGKKRKKSVWERGIFWRGKGKKGKGGKKKGGELNVLKRFFFGGFLGRGELFM